MDNLNQPPGFRGKTSQVYRDLWALTLRPANAGRGEFWG